MLRFIVFSALCGAAVGLLFGLVGSEQSVAVTGRLQCNGAPARHVRVKLYEKEATFDKLLMEGTTDDEGVFHLQGKKTEVSTIDPKVNVYHKCNYNGICYRKMSLTVPDSFVTDGPNPSKTFDVGVINLANKFSGDSTDCLN